MPTRRPVVAPRAPAVMVASGLVWAAALLAALIVGPIGLVVVFVPVVLVASGSGLRLSGVPVNARPLVALLAVAVPVCSLGGPAIWGGAAVASVLAVGAILSSQGQSRPARVVTLVCGPAIATGAVVAAAHQDPGVGSILVIAACLFDVGNFVVGTGATGGALGALAGSGLVAIMMAVVSALVDASLHGRPIWVLSALLVVLLPLGVSVGRRVSRRAVLPALRRVDSLLVAAPAWVLAVALLVHR